MLRALPECVIKFYRDEFSLELSRIWDRIARSPMVLDSVYYSAIAAPVLVVAAAFALYALNSNSRDTKKIQKKY